MVAECMRRILGFERRTLGGAMGRLIRLDRSGHTTIAEWTAGDPAEADRAAALFAEELEQGLIASVDTGEGTAEVVRELPLDAELVVLRRPIAGG
jgi:hypothetical protein